MTSVNIEQIAEEIALKNENSLYFDLEAPVLLMVSGGSDSTALAYVFACLKKKSFVKHLAALHVNHKLRGQDSEMDATFTQQLCDHLDIPLFLAEVDIAYIASSQSKNIEDIARKERYKCAQEALQSLCQHSNKKFEDGLIATAHTLDDRIETFYMRSIVGCGPGGFRSIKAKNNNIIRLLLPYQKSQLREAINNIDDSLKVFDENHRAWREDLTNFKSDRFRTYIRNKLIPLLEDYDRNFSSPLMRTMDLIANEDDMLFEMAKDALNSHCEIDKIQNIAKISPSFASVKLPLQRRAIFLLLNMLFNENERVSMRSVEAVCNAFKDNCSKSGYVNNLQCDFVVSSNKKGVLIEPVSSYRARRKQV